MSTRLALLLAAFLVAGCDDDDTLTVEDFDSSVQVVNATRTPLELRIDGSSVVTIGVARVSTPFRLSSGRHEIQLIGAPEVSARVTVNVDPGVPAIAVIVPANRSETERGIVARVLADTGRIVPAGKSKLRVANFASTTVNVDIWRTQPDHPDPVRVMAPFPFRSVSPYLESDAGVWEVFVTPAGGTTRLVTTGPLAIPSGERRTVVLIDSVGVLRLRVLGDRDLLAQ